MLKIWGRNTSSNVQKVIWALAEMKLPFERIDVGGAKQLTLEVDFGRNGDIQDRFDWIEPGLVK